MKAYLPQVEEPAGAEEIKIYYAEYDIEKWDSLDHEAFMSFKENTFRNREIPYVRYYRNGEYYRDSNYISLAGFKERLGVSGN
jgi:hypothetical protein